MVIMPRHIIVKLHKKRNKRSEKFSQRKIQLQMGIGNQMASMFFSNRKLEVIVMMAFKILENRARHDGIRL